MSLLGHGRQKSALPPAAPDCIICDFEVGHAFSLSPGGARHLHGARAGTSGRRVVRGSHRSEAALSVREVRMNARGRPSVLAAKILVGTEGAPIAKIPCVLSPTRLDPKALGRSVPLRRWSSSLRSAGGIGIQSGVEIGPQPHGRKYGRACLLLASMFILTSRTRQGRLLTSVFRSVGQLVHD